MSGRAKRKVIRMATIKNVIRTLSINSIERVYNDLVTLRDNLLNPYDFSNREFTTLHTSCLCTTLKTLLNYGLIEVKSVDTYHVYVDDTCYGGDVIDMTDEDYERLPEFFKGMVKMQTRKRNHYTINVNNVNEFIALASRVLASIEE